MAQFIFSVSLPEGIAARLATLAEIRGVSRNKLLREGVDLVLAKYAPKTV